MHGIGSRWRLTPGSRLIHQGESMLTKEALGHPDICRSVRLEPGARHRTPRRLASLVPEALEEQVFRRGGGAPVPGRPSQMRMGKPPGWAAWPRRWVRGLAGQDVTVAREARPAFPQRTHSALQSFLFHSLTSSIERLDNYVAHLPYVETEA